MSRTATQNLDDAILSLTQQIADMYTNRKPSYSENGRSVSWGELYRSLKDDLEGLLELRQRVAGPYEVVSRARG